MAGQAIIFVFTDEFKRSYQKLSLKIKRKIKKQMRFLKLDIKHPSLNIHKLNDEWEFYVDIHYRCFFQRSGNKIFLLTVGSHKIIDRYKN